MNGKFLLLVLVFIIGGSAMIVQATRAGASPMLMPSDLVNSSSDVPRVRVAGRVAASEVSYVTSPKAVLKFSVEDPKHPERGSVPVVYEGVRPDMFASGRDVILDGAFVGGTLHATGLLTQCPSKYEAPDPDKLYSDKHGSDKYGSKNYGNENHKTDSGNSQPTDPA